MCRAVHAAPTPVFLENTPEGKERQKEKLRKMKKRNFAFFFGQPVAREVPYTGGREPIESLAEASVVEPARLPEVLQQEQVKVHWWLLSTHVSQHAQK